MAGHLAVSSSPPSTCVSNRAFFVSHLTQAPCAPLNSALATGALQRGGIQSVPPGTPDTSPRFRSIHNPPLTPSNACGQALHAVGDDSPFDDVQGEEAGPAADAEAGRIRTSKARLQAF